MIWNTFLSGLLFFNNSSHIGMELPDDGIAVLAPVQRPVPVVVPDGGTIIFGGLPPIKVGPVR
jgi:hypothetical protein